MLYNKTDSKCKTTEPAVLFIGHESYVDHILVVGSLLFSSSGDGTVRVWDKEVLNYSVK